jgi:ABC-type sugar transport system ATPase subunit
VNCLAGVYPPTAGRILLDGAAVQLPHPLEARRQGIDAVFQDLALADLQPVYMNLFLGRELVRGPLRRLDRETMAAETQLMDEPTASLGVAETRRVEALIRRLRDRGTEILLVSHSLDQVFRLADRICVLRRGRQVGTRTTAQTTGEEIVAMITGLV